LQSQDLARAFVQVLGNEKASKQVFNISGDKYVTFDGLAKACAKVMLPNEYLNGKEK
jgi:nucleoside-diphosphate-sugar epimerase